MAAKYSDDNGQTGLVAGLCLVAGLGLLGLVLLRTAWLNDDAYITFRTADNLLNGHGLRWNIAERVQVFTNPLWLFLIAGVYAFTQEMFLTPMAVSIVVTLLAVSILVAGLSKSGGAAVLAVAVLLFSRAFIDYSTSGLENPLTHLLLALFLLVFFRVQHGFWTYAGLAFFGGLVALNRMDALLLVVPALAYGLMTAPCRRTVFAYALGLLPFIAWLGFATVYFGFPLPNTAFAKLGTGIPDSELVVQGLRYFQNSLTRDPLTLPAIVFGLALAAVRRDGKSIAIAAGIVLYLLYTVRIGGDFMAGRFFAAPLFLAMALVVRSTGSQRVLPWSPAIAAAVVLSFLAPFAPITTGASFGQDTRGFKDDHGIGDERRFYFQNTGLLHYRAGSEMPRHRFADEGRAYALQDNPGTHAHGSVGFRGFFGGPEVHIIDYFALADPLLARLPAEYTPEWRIGHFRRSIPVGYQQTAGATENRLRDRQIAEYYDQLRLIISGPLWTAERWRAIFEMNAGMKEHLVDYMRYRYPRMQRATLADLSEPVPRGYVWNGVLATVLQKDGILVDLERPYQRSMIEMSMDHNDIYKVVFLRRGEKIGTVYVEPRLIAGGGMTTEAFAAPNAAVRDGYDALHILPLGGDNLYSIGHIRIK